MTSTDATRLARDEQPPGNIAGERRDPVLQALAHLHKATLAISGAATAGSGKATTQRATTTLKR